MRMTGMFSGMDTEAMVTAMMKAESMKYDKLKQKRTLLEWKQEAYRNIATNMKTFQATMLSATAVGSISMPSTFSTFKSSILNMLDGKESTAIKVSAAGAKNTGSHKIEVHSVAQKDTYVGDAKNSVTSTGDSAFKAGDKITLDGGQGAPNVVYTFTDADIARLDNLETTLGRRVKADDYYTEVASILSDRGWTLSDGTAVSAIGDVNYDTASGSFVFHDITGDVVDAKAYSVENNAFNKLKPISTGDSFKISLNGGVDFTVTFNINDIARLRGLEFSNTDEYNEEIAAIVNEKLASRFGYDLKIGADGKPVSNGSGGYETDNTKQKVSFRYDANLGFTFDVGAGHTIVLQSDAQDALSKLGFKNGQTNAFDTRATLASYGLGDARGKVEFEINGKYFEFSQTDTFERVMSEINNSGAGVTLSYDKLRSSFKLESKATGASGRIANAYDMTHKAQGDPDRAGLGFLAFTGLVEVDAATGAPVIDANNNSLKTDAAHKISTASDAAFSYNGLWMTRESNSFQVDGLDVTLTEAAVGNTFTININQDTTQTFDAIKKFVEEYNKMVELFTTQTTTNRAKSDKYTYYEPLTEEQRSAMNEKDIELWEEKAKTGMLYRDNIVSQIATQMREMMYTQVTREDGSKISLYQIGITTSSDDNYGGKLKIDESKLKAALEKDPEAIKDLFTQSAYKKNPDGSWTNELMPMKDVNERNARMPHEGIAERLNDIIKNAVEFEGSIYNHAGIKGTAYATNNTISRQLSDYDNKLDDMIKLLMKREDYYYQMFARMESAMAKADSQSSSIAAMLGGGA
jgi:flagellar hook-associated protein 2